MSEGLPKEWEAERQEEIDFSARLFMDSVDLHEAKEKLKATYDRCGALFDELDSLLDDLESRNGSSKA
jgi:hypothetical protein